jgi:hypothetical protein
MCVPIIPSHQPNPLSTLKVDEFVEIRKTDKTFGPEEFQNQLTVRQEGESVCVCVCVRERVSKEEETEWERGSTAIHFLPLFPQAHQSLRVFFYAPQLARACAISFGESELTDARWSHLKELEGKRQARLRMV